MEFGLHHIPYPGSRPLTLETTLRMQLATARAPNPTVLVSGYANHNGIVRIKGLLQSLNRAAPGTVRCFLAGSRTDRTCSRQAVEALLDAGCHVHLLDKSKRFLHAKLCLSDGADPPAILTSGNLTPSGMFRNLEFVAKLDDDDCQRLGLTAAGLDHALRHHLPFVTLTPRSRPGDAGWELTYDETTTPPGGWGVPDIAPDEPATKVLATAAGNEVVLGVTLSRHEAGRIADPPAPGTPYVYLSKQYLGYLPALLTPFPENPRSADPQNSGHRGFADIEFLDVDQTVNQSVNLFDQGNQDLRLGVGPLGGTALAVEGDLVLLRRTGYATYRLRIVRREDPLYQEILPYLGQVAGGAGKRLGFVPASLVSSVI